MKTTQEKITEILRGINVEYGDDTEYHMIWNAAIQTALDNCYQFEGRMAILDFELENLLIEI